MQTEMHLSGTVVSESIILMKRNVVSATLIAFQERVLNMIAGSDILPLLMDLSSVDHSCIDFERRTSVEKRKSSTKTNTHTRRRRTTTTLLVHEIIHY